MSFGSTHSPSSPTSTSSLSHFGGLRLLATSVAAANVAVAVTLAAAFCWSLPSALASMTDGMVAATVLVTTFCNGAPPGVSVSSGGRRFVMVCWIGGSGWYVGTADVLLGAGIRA